MNKSQLVEDVATRADVDKATLDQVPAQFRPSTGKWTGIAARSTPPPAPARPRGFRSGSGKGKRRLLCAFGHQ